MAERRGEHVIVFHSGALGDFVMTWPLLRALRASGAKVTVVARPSHARLAARSLGVAAVDGERMEMRLLWGRDVIDDAASRAWRAAVLGTESPPTAVVSFIAEPTTELGSPWAERARELFPTAELLFAGPPRSASRARLWQWAQVDRYGSVPARTAPRDGPVVCHIGAGGREKVWPMNRWLELAGAAPLEGRARLIAGEVELERMSSDERSAFASVGGEFVPDLHALAEMLMGAHAFVGVDSGPAHLAAQLGTPTLVLFGPTDPAVWTPVGPRVLVVRSEDGLMHSLSVEQVRLSLRMLQGDVL